ncbi:MAG TPA: acetate kinase [Verrucomicrobiota bacterium]|nr:acetate kinase [Verrucomicrobiota bacterium]
MKILVANLGSTSLKYRLFDCSDNEERLLARGGFERVSDYAEAVNSCLKELTDAGHITGEKDLTAVGFKPVIARGVTGCVRMDERVLAAMEAYREMAPAHNPPYIDGVRLFAKRMPTTPMIGLFETSFYQWVPEAAVRYAVPQDWYEEGVRRWGFHGASHKFIAERSAELLGRSDVAERVRMLYANQGATPVQKPNLRVVSCHLGGSSSITAILNGVAICNSLGMSPQSGLPQNNRVGDLDSFAIPFMMRRKGLSLQQIEHALCKEAGLKGLSGGYNDMREITEQASRSNKNAQLAIDVLVWQARHWLGACIFQMNGVDAIAFTAGIAENNPHLRAQICENLDNLGIKLDRQKNAVTKSNVEVEISAADSSVKIFIIPTNEELVIAREVKRLLLN